MRETRIPHPATRNSHVATTLPHGRIVNLEGVDYGIHFLAPEPCVKAVREFLGFCPPGSRQNP